MKRGFDIIAALVLVVLAAPVMSLAAAAILLTQGRPVVFSQTRVGQGGKHFRLYKFRSMVTNASAIGGISTQDNDPRITTIGRFLRRTSLDELPQLVNVLIGDMSLVGPRPDTPAQKVNYDEDSWCLRHSVRPGITGPAQAKYRSNATPQQRLDTDLNYAREPRLMRDFAILWQTLKQVITKGGN